MIEFLSEAGFSLEDEQAYTTWIERVIEFEGFSQGDISYVFCDDDFLHKMNIDFLNHDTLTDIITFDYTVDKQVHAEIYISVERVRDNADSFNVPFENELKRVIIHGILHLLGYKDKTEEQQSIMRLAENKCIAVFPK
ncbi:MAG: rRNA maturation RNase YbeY [Fulvivirga sp.]